MTRAAFVGSALVAILLAFGVPYAARGGLRSSESGDAAQAAPPQALAGPAAGSVKASLGPAPVLPALRPAGAASPGPATAPRAAAPAVPIARAAPTPVVVPRFVPAPPRPSRPAPAPNRGSAGGGNSGGGGSGGGGSFDDSG